MVGDLRAIRYREGQGIEMNDWSLPKVFDRMVLSRKFGQHGFCFELGIHRTTEVVGLKAAASSDGQRL